MTSYLLSGPADEPVTLDEARAFVRVEGSAEDALLEALVTTARLQVESATGRALIAQDWRLVLDDWPPDRRVRLPIAPLVSLTSITTYDPDSAATVEPLTDVLVDAHAEPPQLLLPAGFGAGPLRERQGIAIDYRAGYGETAADVPAPLRQAALLLIAYWFENRDMAALPAGPVPAGIDRLVAPYRMVRL
jgi:uncharacterized phiE125 gp8 family phage protein